METTIQLFKALGDETRMKILLLILNRGMCSKGIARHLNVTEAAISQHIKILKEAKLIIGYKVGYHIIYDLNEVALKDSINFLEKLINNDIKENKNIQISNIRKFKCFKECKHKKCSHSEIFKEELSMKICFPVKENNGVKSIPYGHFGTAPLFLIFNLESNEVNTIGNGDLGHEHGKCQPIKALSGEVIDAVVVGGIGQGAITKLNSMGVKVFKAVEGTIEDNLNLYKNGELKEFSSNHKCNHDGCSH
ncbi:hypothetical protein JCM1393_23080 [Clostridium carnis]